MKKRITLNVLLFFSFGLSLSAQLLVDPANEWYLDDCCFVQGNFNCSTYSYSFGEVQEIDGEEYRPLITTNPGPTFPLGEYFREENGQVFMKHTIDDPETLIYDFNLELGGLFNYSGPENSYHLQVTGIDTITLNNGELRKRLELTEIEYNTTIYWISGIGANLSPFIPDYAFTLDCSNEFNCFHVEEEIEYAVGNCLLTNASDLMLQTPAIKVYPNPAGNQLYYVNGQIEHVSHIEVIECTGRRMIYTKYLNKEIDISRLSAGIYFLKTTFKNGDFHTNRFIKN